MWRSGRPEEAELRGVGCRWWDLARDVMTGFEQSEDLPRPRHDRSGEAGEPPYVDAVGAVRPTGLEAMQEHDLLPGLTHSDVEVPRMRELLGQLRQLVVVGREDRFAPDGVVQELGDRPRDRDPIVGRGAPADL